MRLKNKLVVITGAASGMGRAGVELFAREGATVVGVDINAEQLQKVIEGAKTSNAPIFAIAADLTRREETKGMIHEAARLMGGIDILWNNAGTAGPAEVEGLDTDQYDRAIELNLTAGVLATGEVISYMRKRGGGSIVFTSSISGIAGSLLSPTYSAAKFGVVGFAMSMALRHAKDNIRVNAICPGMTQTGLLDTFMSRANDPELIKQNTIKFIEATPLGRIARPEEIAHAALWLASDDASFVTGIAMPVDGGVAAKP